MLFSFISYLEHEKRVSRHTILAYQKDLDQFMEFINTAFGMAHPEEAGHAEIRAWMVDLIEDGLEVATVNRKMATLRSFYKFLLRSEIISKDPTFKIRSLKKGRSLPAFIQEKEIQTLLEES
ncbi:site-specific integrase, partial [uncultured Cyclobacterium sp.]|uniref:site-specific integrase n=1 Tax=uncultured Cyclobacterium sp. TaxID=453820 RepID=UPI0030EEA5A0